MIHSKVLVAMSGGVDSSMAALLLHEQGYDVIGVTMKVWDYSLVGVSPKETGCCNLDTINDARNLAVQAGFPHYIIDLTTEFSTYVISNFISEYLSGRTPNPCIICNTKIKWEALLKKADALNCEYIATGHYARLREENGRFVISKGADKEKDQSYVLWGLSQQALKRTLFPLGEFTKQQIRQIAIEKGFNNLAMKKESYEICFIPDNNYRNFLKTLDGSLESRLNGGNFISSDGKVIGKHKGYPFYTIGQRKGLNIAMGYPVYVLEINPDTNIVVLGRQEQLKKKELTVKDINLIKYANLPAHLEVETKVRYRDKGALSRLTLENDKVKVLFHEAVTAVTPGQSAVFYEDNDVVGGGIID